MENFSEQARELIEKTFSGKMDDSHFILKVLELMQKIDDPDKFAKIWMEALEEILQNKNHLV